MIAVFKPFSTMSDSILRKIYYDIGNPASFSSAERLYSEAIKHNKKIKLSDVKKFLSGELTFTLHKRIVRKFKRNPVVASHHAKQAQADLVDIQKYSNHNHQFRYVLTVIDVFSRFAYALPLKSKEAQAVCEAFKTIFKTYKPAEIQTDEGKEFVSKSVQQLFKNHLIRWYVAKNESIKCSIVERFQRTLMTKVQKMMTARGTLSFTDELPKFLSAYNNAYHRSIRMTPSQAVQSDPKTVFKNIYGFEDERALLKNMYKRPKISEKSSVRVPYRKQAFQKGYTQNYSDEIFTVDQAFDGLRNPVYRLKNSKGQVLKGRFYPEELQEVKNSDTYRIQVLKERKKGRSKEYFVHYVNFPDSENEWVPASRLKQIS